MKKLKLKVIHNAKEHRAALATIERLWEAKPGTPDHDALEGLPNVEQLRAAIAQLPERQRLIIERRMTMTLKEVGEEIGITRERVRQIELVAKATIKSLLTQGAR